MIAIPLRILSSKAFLIWIVGGWIVYYVLSAIWLREAFAAFVAGLRENLIMQISFLFFLVSGYLNVARALKAVFRKSWIHCIAWLVLSLGVLLFFTGFFMSAAMRESGQRFIGEGDIINPPWTQERYRVMRIDPGLKDRLIDMNAAGGIFAYEPKITVLDQSSRSYTIGAFPPAKLKGTYYHIMNFGIAPGVRVFEEGRLKDQSHVILRIVAQGSSDYFDLPGYPYRFLVTIEAGEARQAGKRAAASLNLKDPLFSVRVFKGERVIAEGDSRRGIAVGNLAVRFFQPAFWVQLEAVKDSGVQVMHAGIVLVTIGVPLFLIFIIVNLCRRKGS